MRKINFSKMVASGNDFIVIDNRRHAVKKNLSKLAKQLCLPKFSVGADGLMVIERSKKADFKMRIFNADGSEAQMCGNGARCISLYAYKNKIAGKKMRFETIAGIIGGEIRNSSVKVGLSKPKGTKLDLVIRTAKDEPRPSLQGHQCQQGRGEYFIHYVNTGVPHVVMFVDELEKINVKEVGKLIRFHRVFSPAGTNVNFVKVGEGNKIKIRTYERGVEGETFACGTGSVASAIISAKIKHLKPPVDVLTKSGEVLKVYFDLNDKEVENVYLEGKAREVFTGIMEI